MLGLIVGIFLFVALSVAACRALDAIRSHDAKAPRKPEVTSYRGPVYSRHGNEVR